MEKWIAFATEHGLAVVGALLLAIAAVGWVEPTTPGGVAFLMFLVFIVALAALEVVNRAWTALRHRRQEPTDDGPAETSKADQTGDKDNAATTPVAATNQSSQKTATGQ